MKYIFSKLEWVVKIVWPPTQVWKNFKEVFLDLKDWEYYLDLKKKRKIRSPNQNNFYWWPFLDCLLTEMWEINKEMMSLSEIDIVKEAMHEYLKKEFNLSENSYLTFRNPNDKRKRFSIPIWTWKSTTELDTKEFEQYLERIRNHFASWGWKLPYPEDEQEYWFLNDL